MEQLTASQYPAAYALYLHHSAYFPLIATVLSGKQDGVVHADSAGSPTQVYVEHNFGFAQVFGASVPAFELALQRHWLIDKAFASAKVRLYTPSCPDFLKAGEHESLRSWRQRFQLAASQCTHAVEQASAWQSKGVVFVRATASHVNMIETAFGVVGRFWRTPGDFVEYSNAVLALCNEQPATLCYAAAVGDGKAEIDVLTLPAFRHLGLAKAVVHLFNERCLSQNVQPLWDCFTNNAASMALCQSAGFVPASDPYAFFTINR